MTIKMETLFTKLINKKLVLILILILAAFLRFYQLGNIPAGLTNDEVNKGYDSYSLALTAHDQWNKFLPINFIGFGDYSAPLYRYLGVIPIYLFGLNAYSVRIVSALAGLLSVAMIYLLGKKMFNEQVGIFSALLFAISPWAIGMSRIALESNIAILFTLLALYFGIKNDGKNMIRNLSISSFFLSLTLFTYSAYTLFAPLVLFVILVANYYKKKTNIKFIIPALIFLLLVGSIFIKKDSASVRFSQVGILTNVNSIGLKNTLDMQRGQCLKSFPSLICRAVDNKIILFASTLGGNFLSHFSPNFLYISGTPTQFSALEKRGLDYTISSIFLLSGLLFLIKKNKDIKISLVLFSLTICSAIPDSLTGDGNFSRASIMQPFIILITGAGLYYLLVISGKFRSNNLRLSSYIIVALIIIFSATSFYINYLTYFKNNYSIYSQYGYEELMTKVGEQKKNYDAIYIARHLNDAKQYVYYLFYNKYDPKKYQKKENVSYSYQSDGWISIDRIDNIYFTQNPPSISNNVSLQNKKILVISNSVDFPEDVEYKFVIKDNLGDVIFKAVNFSDLLDYNRRHGIELSKDV